jgi:hypothetical protein
MQNIDLYKDYLLAVLRVKSPPQIDRSPPPCEVRHVDGIRVTAPTWNALTPTAALARESPLGWSASKRFQAERGRFGLGDH